MSNDGNSTNPKETFDAWRWKKIDEIYYSWEYFEPKERGAMTNFLVKGRTLYDAWEASVSASDIEELKAGGTPESFRVMREAFLKLTDWEGPLPD